MGLDDNTCQFFERLKSIQRRTHKSQVTCSLQSCPCRLYAPQKGSINSMGASDASLKTVIFTLPKGLVRVS